MILSAIKRWSKPLLGAGLLVALLLQLDLAAIQSVIRGADWGWLVLGLISLVVSNLLSAYRWQCIAELLGVSMPLSRAVVAYVQGITANTVLPGGIVGGDIWRALALVKYGQKINETAGLAVPKKTAAHSVFLDRLSGVWVLVWVSLIASGLGWFLGLATDSLTDSRLLPYALVLLCLAVGPHSLLFVVRFLKFPPLHSLLKIISPTILSKTVLVSLVVQVFAVFAFWCCFQAIGQAISPLALAMVCAGIFISAVIPAAIGGFGARELGAIAFLASIGIISEMAFTASVLYGLLATAQGLIGVYWWVKRPIA